MNKWSNSAFNNLFYSFSSAPSKIDLDTFFYPLDKINNWNRAYGKRGFTQYQVVIPESQGIKGVSKFLTLMQNKGLHSYLTVLKKFGPGRGFMSFPIPGYTLALDFPVTKNNLKNINEVDNLVHDLGGRVYLAKDSRLSKDNLAKGYPEAEEFRELIKDLPFRSNLAERLQLK